MFDFDKVPLPDYTRKEDTVNSVTHALGVPLAIYIAISLLIKSDFQLSGTRIIALIIYTLSMIELYFGSAFYHGLKPGRTKKIARVLDHSNIFVMISGSLTAFYLFAIIEYAKTFAIISCTLSWVVSIIGIIMTFADQEKFKKIQMAMYLILGWSAMAGGVFLCKYGGEAGKQFFLYICIGGALYSIGAILYGVGKKIRYIHAVFHIFILSATVVQYIAICNYI